MSKRCLVISILVPLVFACGDATMPGADRHYVDVATGGEHSCAIAVDLTAYCWGRGADGELGTGKTDDEMFPVPVNAALKFKQLVLGAAHTCGLGTDDRAYCWGWNVFYQMGDSTSTRRLTPVPVAFDLKYTRLAAGNYHTCGITTDNKVYCWGYNRFGQAGNGTTQVTIYPVQVVGGIRASAITAGGEHTCAILIPGGTSCWGSNATGQLGIGSDRSFVAEPTPVVGGAQFTSIDAGENHTCAVNRNFLPFCWGYNEFGQIGDAAPWRPGLAGPSAPVPVVLLTEVVQISAGTNHTCALDNDRKVWCWGRGTYGQLGIGDRLDYSTRQPIIFQPRLQNTASYVLFQRVSAGGATHACALADDALFCWGSGDKGELGNRNKFALTPQRVD